IPVVLAAFLLHHVDDISVYKDGTFIPVLGPEHFELLVKAPERFAVKFIEVVGLRSQVFRELEEVLRGRPLSAAAGIRNATMLSVVKPLFQFVRKLPPYTLKTERLSPGARNVIQTLLKAQEPDELLFVTLPQACGLAPIRADQEDDGKIARQFKQTLVQLLKEIQTAYDVLLTDCQTLLCEAFGLPDRLRETLRVRSRPLRHQVIEQMLNRFVNAAVDEAKDDQAWLEALVMIVADKPAASWTDGDRAQFELKLKDLARRFQRLEVLRLEMGDRPRNGFNAYYVTVSQPDGREVNRMVWSTEEQEAAVDSLIDKVLDQCDPQLQDILHARFTKRLYGSEPEPELPQQQPERRQKKHKRIAGHDSQ
ncbi:MAG: hypothetical protein VKK04_22210, partial [Synechococcales bacterium]|nr:hypothetical protein [Synechococcales bacterium]